MSAASRCLQNALILQKILESSDLLANLQFRLVDKRFNREILHRIRVSHRKINIYIVVQILLDSSPKIAVNGSFYNPRDCFMFLINTVGVRIEEFELKTDRNVLEIIPNLSWTPLISSELHKDMNVLLKDQTLNVFKGMNDLCEFGCPKCREFALRSRSYGPIQHHFLTETFKEPKHFDHLIVDDYLMSLVPGTCNLFSVTRETYDIEWEKHINSNISCDHLQMPLYNHPDFYEDGQRTPIDSELPRELLEDMCMKWRPKSVGLSVISLLFGRETATQWQLPGNRNRFRTEFRFFDPYRNTRASRGFMLDHVNVDMDDAPLDAIFREDSSFFDDNLIANVRKVFPARHYFFNLHRMSTCHQLDQCRLEQLIRTVIRGSNQSNTSPVTVRISIDITDKPFDMPETLSVEERVFTCSVSRNSIEDVFRGTRRIAKSFLISDKRSGLEVILEVYVDKKQLQKAIGKHVDSGFLNHYLE